jgi:hypothetical protein
MDVLKTINGGAASPVDLLGKLNKRRTATDGSWNAALNRALAAPKPLTFMGVTHERTLENAKVSDSSIATAQSAFAKAMNGATEQRQPLSADKAAQLEQSSQVLVNQFFMGSMLKQMRESPFKNEMFSGGKGGDAYAGLFDQHISENAGGRIAKSLVKSMVKQYQRTAANVGGGMS